MSIKRYSEVIRIPSFIERLKYLQLDGMVGHATFGGHRYLNQLLYRDSLWKKTRREVILRDDGCDLAHEDYSIPNQIYVHHINPITIEDILERRSCVFDLENLICTSFNTHQDIHYGKEVLCREPILRKPNDTSPWR